MVPPIRYCICEDCPQRGMALGGNRKEFLGNLFTRGRGVLPIVIMSLYCRGILASVFHFIMC